MPLQADIADAVVTGLNGHKFSQKFTAVRCYRPQARREDLGTLHVLVAPGPVSSGVATRGKNADRLAVEIGVLKAVATPDDLTALDGLASLVEEIDLFLRRQNLATQPRATWEGSETIDGAEAGFSKEFLDQQHVFLSVLRVTYLVFRRCTWG